MSNTTKPNTGNTPNAGNSNTEKNTANTTGTQPGTQRQGAENTQADDRQPGTERRGAEGTQMQAPGQKQNTGGAQPTTGRDQHAPDAQRDQQTERMRNEQGGKGHEGTERNPAADEDNADRKGPAATGK